MVLVQVAVGFVVGSGMECPPAGYVSDKIALKVLFVSLPYSMLLTVGVRVCFSLMWMIFFHAPLERAFMSLLWSLVARRHPKRGLHWIGLGSPSRECGVARFFQTPVRWGLHQLRDDFVRSTTDEIIKQICTKPPGWAMAAKWRGCAS